MTGLEFADRTLPNAADDLRRYVGLPWSGGAPEVWAYRYYDQIEDSEPSQVLPVDVLAVAALHPSLKRQDLAWFVDNHEMLRHFLSTVEDEDLATADPAQLDRLTGMAGTGVELSLLTKVLHRKRPRLIPLLDRRLIDWYRFRISARGAAAWPEVTRELAQDLRSNRAALEELQHIAPLSHLRIADIAIWMEAVK